MDANEITTGGSLGVDHLFIEGQIREAALQFAISLAASEAFRQDLTNRVPPETGRLFDLSYKLAREFVLYTEHRSAKKNWKQDYMRHIERQKQLLEDDDQ